LNFISFAFFSVKLVELGTSFFLSHDFWQQVWQRISGLRWLSNSVSNFRDIFVLDSFEIPAAWTSTFSLSLISLRNEFSCQRWVGKLFFNFDQLFGMATARLGKHVRATLARSLRRRRKMTQAKG